MSQRTPFAHRQHLEVETPEHVILDYEIAGIGSRSLAALADWLILLLVVGGGSTALGVFRRDAPWVMAVLLLGFLAAMWLYFSCFEGLRRGQTPGKRWMGIRVIRDTGHAATFGDAAARNLLLPIDFFCLVGLFFIAIHPRAKRIGDLVAGTVVVRDHPVALRGPLAAAAQEPDPISRLPELAEAEFRLVKSWAERAGTLPPPARARLARDLAGRFAERFPDRPADDSAFLDQLYRQELASRQGRFGGGRGGTLQAAERLRARKGERWREFQAIAERVNRSGLDGLAAGELPDFARRYREVSADLARARTYGAEPAVRESLERLVAAGHNALYREERRTWGRIWGFLTRESPAAVVGAWRHVLLAATVFLLPGAAGFALLRERPALAPMVLPDGMLERAEAGTGRQARGAGYVEALAAERPLMASLIISNNIRVAFMCFAGGVVFGVGALVILALNGLSIGAASGHFANAGLLGYLWTFVIGHGLLELFSIWVAGAAGFLLGRALILPGALPRGDALILAGRLAMRLLGAVVVLLLLAGLIEGFISAGTAPLPARLGVSAGSVVFLVLYLWNGARSRTAAGVGA